MSVPTPSNRSSRFHLTSVLPQSPSASCQYNYYYCSNQTPEVAYLLPTLPTLPTCFLSFHHRPNLPTQPSTLLDYAPLGVFEERYYQPCRPFIRCPLSSPIVATEPPNPRANLPRSPPSPYYAPSHTRLGQPSDECGGEPGTSRGINSNHGASR